MSTSNHPEIHLASLSSTKTAVISKSRTPSLHSSTRSNQTELDLTEDEIAEKPWKYIGYKGYSSFLASEKDFYIFRRFASLNIRIALALQDQVAQLEEELEEIDSEYSRRSAEDLHNGSFRCDREDRTELLEKIALKLSQYNTLVLQQSELEKRPAPARPDIKSIINWHYNHENRAISEAEQSYLTHTQDLFSIVTKEKSPLRRLLERSRKFRIFSFWHQKAAPNLPVYDKDLITYTSDKRIHRFTTILIISVGTLMLIAPMWILEFLGSGKVKLGVITGFIVVFLGLFSGMTDAKPFETLTATAGYSAVLMVFLQFGNGGSS